MELYGNSFLCEFVREKNFFRGKQAGRLVSDFC